MLRSLTLNNFITIERAALEFGAGMTVITGETGAGKSLLLDALGLCLGTRATGERILPGTDSAVISAEFDLAELPEVLTWLEERGLTNPDGASLCLLRRTLARDGRSRAFINSHPTTLTDLRELGEQLADLHTQTGLQALLQAVCQRRMLDSFAGVQVQVQKIADCFADLSARRNQLHRIEHSASSDRERAEWLRYQLQEIDALQMAPGEVPALEQQCRRWSQAETLLSSTAEAIALCDDPESTGALTHLHRALALLEQTDDSDLSGAQELLRTALINLEESLGEMRRYHSGLELDPVQLQALQQRLDNLYEIARKHRVEADEVPRLTGRLQRELETLEQAQDPSVLADEVAALEADYRERADWLSAQRQQAARILEQEVTERLASLSMSGADVVIAVRTDGAPRPWGTDRVEFLVRTVPGAKPAPLGRVASGGELSRISLAIEVVAARHAQVPVLAFDEVDVGVGGRTAEVIGRLLRQLSQSEQVLCITHQPQIAAVGTRHLQAEKALHADSAITAFRELSAEERVEEIARMVGGITISATTRDHAREMLQNAQQ